MHKFLSFNHKITVLSGAHLLPVSPASFYGRGIFTTVAVYDSKPFQWEKHWLRLNENAEAVGIDLSEFPEERVLDSFAKLIERNELQNARARLSFFDESAAGIWKTKTRRKTSLLITTADFRPVSENFRIALSPFQINSRSPLAGVKSCNYLENILALEEARRRGFDEAVRVNEKNEVVSATMANIFWVRKKEIFTAGPGTGALKGTTRDLVLKNFPVREKTAFFDELDAADEIFLTSAGIGIVCVKSLGGRTFEEDETFQKIRALFNELTR